MLPLQEPFRSELRGVRTPDRRVPMDAIDRVRDVRTLGYEDRRLPIGTSATGKRSIDDRVAGVGRHDGVEPQRL